MQKLEINKNKFRTQVKFADKAARLVLGELFRNHRPADRTLSGFFRENRQCGSKDRQFISESIYALLRYWGILRCFLPAERREELEKGNIRLGAQELPALFFAALYLDFQFIPWADALAAEVNIPWPKPANGPSASLLDRAEALAERFGHPGGFSLEMLVPEWVREKLPADFPMERFLDDLQRRPPMWLRAQCGDTAELLDELAEAGLNFRIHEKMENAIAVENSRVNLLRLKPSGRASLKFRIWRASASVWRQTPNAKAAGGMPVRGQGARRCSWRILWRAPERSLPVIYGSTNWKICVSAPAARGSRIS